jgi:indole-3-glycerol phosphate synthase
MHILTQIVKDKREEVAKAKAALPLEALESELIGLPPTRKFKEALRGDGINLIAELKRASPSAGMLRSALDPARTAKVCQENGARAISVLTTKKLFCGSLDFLSQVKEATRIPILQKDFIVDEYQIYQARRWGADAILLIAAILSKSQIYQFMDCARGLGLGCLVEAHTKEELDMVLETEARVIGINNRNLHTLTTSLTTTLRLSKFVPPDRILVSESGIETHQDMQRLCECGVKAFLVGEALMRSPDVGAKIRELLGNKS